MPTLESLPNELQLMIWNVIQPEDIDSYSLASPQIRALVPDILKEHRWLQKHLTSVISYQPAPGEHPEAQHIKVLNLLEIVTANPTHGLYVKNFTIGEGDSRLCFGTMARFAQYWAIPSRVWPSMAAHPHFTSYPNRTLAVPWQQVKDSDNLDTKPASSWIDHLKRGDRGPILAILLTLLPNLTSLEFNGNRVNDDNFLGYIEDITRSPNSTVLSNLASVNLLRIQQVNDATPWKILRVFFNLPSLKVLHASGLKDTSEIARHEIAKFSVEGNSNVTDLKLEHCDMAEWGIQRIFRLFKSLKHFTYDGMAMRSPYKPIPGHETPSEIERRLDRYSRS